MNASNSDNPEDCLVFSILLICWCNGLFIFKGHKFDEIVLWVIDLQMQGLGDWFNWTMIDWVKLFDCSCGLLLPNMESYK